MQHFLEKLKTSVPARGPVSAVGTADGRFLFRISFRSSGEAVLDTIDEKGNPTSPDCRLFNEPLSSVLRSMEQARDEDSFNVCWGDRNEGVSLPKNRHIIYQLMECDNLCDERMSPIIPDNNLRWNWKIQLEEKRGNYEPVTSLYCGEETMLAPNPVDDSFALCDGKLVRTVPIGSNFMAMDAFGLPFPKELLDKYLSVLFTNTENINVCVEGHTVEISDEPEQARPTIVIEKVDEDKALYLRVTQELDGLEPEFLQDFRLTRHASLSQDGKITIRPVSQRNNHEMQNSLLKDIRKYAPSKTEAKEIYNEDNMFIIPEHTAAPFLFNGLAGLVDEYRILGAEKLRGYKVRPVKPKLSVNLGSGIDFLEADVTLNVGDENLSLSSFLQQYRKQRYILLSDGDKAVIDEAWVRRLERLFAKSSKGKAKVSFFDLPEIVQLLEDGAITDNKALQRSRSFYQGFNSLGDSDLEDGGIKAELRPYQKSGIKWMNYLYDNGFGACLADDMGLGKTVQTIALLSRIHGIGKRGRKGGDPSLIVMPKSLLFNWASELERFSPGLKVSTYYGSGRDLEKALEAQVILTTYGMVRSDIDKLREIKFRLVVLDESQNIKNIAAQMSQAVLLLNSEHRIALSGTPVENSLSELYSLFRFLNPAMFGSAASFNENYALPITRLNDKDALEELRRKIYPFILRRTKTEVLDDLPDRTDQKLYVTLDEEHASFYEQRRRTFYETVHNEVSANGISKSRLIILQAMSELRRIASAPEIFTDSIVKSSKLPVLMESLEEAVANGHKAVIFFNFIAGIELVAEKLDAAGIAYVTMTGATRDRGTVVSRFQNEPDCKVLLMTLKTGGVGLNLTAADTVYIFEPWWNRAEEEQAIGRLHRIGQKSKVMTFSIIAAGTIEDKICRLQEQKKMLVDSLISSDGKMDKNITEEDIDFIFKQ